MTVGGKGRGRDGDGDDGVTSLSPSKERDHDHEEDRNTSADEVTAFSPVEMGKKLFQWRDYTPLPLIFLLLFVAEPSAFSATLGTLLVVFGELIRIQSVAFIGSVSRTRTESTGGALITTGPFSYVRNPLYVGNFFITLGIAIYGHVIWLVVLTVLMFGFQYYYIVQFEESLLIKKFGASYKAYQAETPAWIPKKLPRLGEIEWPSSYSDALWSERRTLGAIGAIVLVLALLSVSRG